MDSTEAPDGNAPPVSAASPIKRSNYTRDVHILSTAFLLIFLAYGAAQNLESTLNNEEDLGTISLWILCLSFTFFSLVASLVVRALGSKKALVLGTTGYWLFVAANLKPSWYTMVPASLYLGFAASIIWVGQSRYRLQFTRRRSNRQVQWRILGDVCQSSVCSLALLRDGKNGSTSGKTMLFVVFLCSMTLGTILMCFLHKRDNKGEEGVLDSSVSLCPYIVSVSKSIITSLFDKRMLLTIPLIAFSGLQQAFVWAEYTKYVVSPALGKSGVGGAMAVYGAFDALCSLIAGRLTSSLSSITLIVSGGASVQVIVLLWLLLNYSSSSGVLGIVYPLLMAGMLGIGDGVLNTQLNALLGMLFKQDMEGAFAQLKVWQSASIAVVFFLSSYISFQAMLVIMIGALGVSVAAFLFLTLWVERAFSLSIS